MDNYIVFALSSLLQVVVENDHLIQFMLSVNPPTYQYARYIDWIVPYLLKEQAKNAKQSYNKQMQAKKASLISIALLCMEKIYETARKLESEKLIENGINPEEFYKEPDVQRAKPGDDVIIDQEEEESPILRAYPEPYIVGTPTQVETVKEEEKDGV